MTRHQSMCEGGTTHTSAPVSTRNRVHEYLPVLSESAPALKTKIQTYQLLGNIDPKSMTCSRCYKEALCAITKPESKKIQKY